MNTDKKYRACNANRVSKPPAMKHPEVTKWLRIWGIVGELRRPPAADRLKMVESHGR